VGEGAWCSLVPLRLNIGPHKTIPPIYIESTADLDSHEHRDSNLKAATIPIEGGQYWPVGMFMGSQRW
jgi:hypothetical protein